MRQRDEVAFTSFVTAQWPGLLRTAFLLTGDHQLAEDLAQATLTKVYVAWPRITRMDHPGAYARKVMTNQATSWWRRRSASELPADLGAGEAWHEGFDDSVAQSCTVWKAVLDLPRRQRAVVVLRYYQDLTIPEIASVLDMAEGTVKSHLNAAKRTLGAHLGETHTIVAGGEAT
ncbi:MAG: SigE family RNA polymerase sigma factor [Nocardioidaceae bacterium]